MVVFFILAKLFQVGALLEDWSAGELVVAFRCSYLFDTEYGRDSQIAIVILRCFFEIIDALAVHEGSRV